MGVSPKWVKSKRRREKIKRRLNDGENNGQATHGARRHAWRTQAAWANYHVSPEREGIKIITFDHNGVMQMITWIKS